jgi:hypothetical protein
MIKVIIIVCYCDNLRNDKLLVPGANYLTSSIICILKQNAIILFMYVNGVSHNIWIPLGVGYDYINIFNYTFNVTS